MWYLVNLVIVDCWDNVGDVVWYFVRCFWFFEFGLYYEVFVECDGVRNGDVNVLFLISCFEIGYGNNSWDILYEYCFSGFFVYYSNL